MSRQRIMAGMIGGLVLVAASTADHRPRLVWNASASAPIGLYAASPPKTPDVGRQILYAPPPSQAAIFAARRYVPISVLNRKAFADRAGNDRHHFRFIVSPEDADQMADLQGFTRALVGTMEKDLGTELDWVAGGHLRVRSDLKLEDQIGAQGATWLDRLRVDPNRPALNSTTGAGFAAEVAAAFEQRGEWLVSQGLAERSPDGIKAKPRLLATLTARELEAAAAEVAAKTGLARRPDDVFGEGDIYRRRLNLASGRFALIDDSTGFSLVPWRPAMERHLGQTLPSGLGRSGPGDPPAPDRRRGPSL